MILDAQNLFSENQAITATANSTNIIDLGAESSLVQRFISKIGEAKLWAIVTEAFNNLTSLDIVIQTSATEAFTSTTEVCRASVNLANLTKGKQVALAGAIMVTLRYIRARYVVTGAAPTTGQITCGFVLQNQTNGMPV